MQSLSIMVIMRTRTFTHIRYGTAIAAQLARLARGWQTPMVAHDLDLLAPSVVQPNTSALRDLRRVHATCYAAAHEESQKSADP